MNTLNQLFNCLIQQNREQERQAKEAEPDPEGEAYQATIARANAEHATREMLPQLRAMSGRDY